MELRMHLHRWERHEPDWTAAAVSGFAAGAVLMVLELLWAGLLSGASTWRIPHLVAAILLGPESLRAPAEVFDLLVVAAALATHYLLGCVFGMALGFLSAGFRYDTSPVGLALIGLVFGALLYLFSFHVATHVFWWLVELRGWKTLIAHLIFGVTASLLYWKLARHPTSQPHRP